MNHPTELNSELLSADARGRKHIPVAVFAVILIHIVLFVVLLIAAGCRSSARAKATRPAPEPAQLTHPAEKYMQAATNAVAVPPLAATSDPVMAEPLISEEQQPRNVILPPQERQSQTAAAVAAPLQKTTARPAQKTKALVRQQALYVVQSGDTVEKIAKRHGTSVETIKTANKLKGHMIYPGQKLVVKPGPAGATAEVKKARSSNEV